jgi:hypothetical protein
MNRDFSELLLALNANGVEYLVVGAHAMAVYGHVRATKDLDVWIRADRENALRALKAISEFGAPLGDLTVDDLSTRGTIFQIVRLPCGSTSSQKLTALISPMPGPLALTLVLAGCLSL